MRFRDPFSSVPLKIKLPLGFIVLFLCVVGAAGYFVLGSVYTPFNREIMLRLEREAETLATLFDQRMESLRKRSEDFASDGLIRDMTEPLVTGTTIDQANLALLKHHLETNKLPLVKEFTDLIIYDQNGRRIVGVTDQATDIDTNTRLTLIPTSQRVSAILPPTPMDAFPRMVIVTPLRDLTGKKLLGYFVSVADLSLIIGAVASHDVNTADTDQNKFLRLVDQTGQTLEAPWWYLQALHRGQRPSADERGVGLKLFPAGGRGNGVPETASQTARLESLQHTRSLLSTGWRLTVELDAREALFPLRVLEGRFVGIVGVMATAILLLLFLAIYCVVRPLGELQLMALRIKDGDFSARNTIDTEDEIGTLAHTANLMAQAVQDRTANLEHTANDLKRREADLRAQHDLLNSVIQSMTDGVLLIKNDGIVALANASAQPLLELIHNHSGHLGIQKCERHETDSAKCVSCMSDPLGATGCVITVNGLTYEVLSTQIPYEHDSSKVLVARNITEREAMRRQQAHQERLTVLGKLSAVVAHEMNNPLAAISMYNQMMEAELPSESPFMEHVTVINRNTDTCQRIIKELLDYARTPQPNIEEVDLHRLLEDVLHFLRPFHQKAGVQVVKQFEAQETRFWADATQTQQVFVNLLVNAFQAVEGREGRLVIRTLPDPGGESVVVTIEDNGAGIPKQLQPEIFEPFFTTKRSGGTGLGLSTSRQIINAHGGKLELLTSEPGKTVFCVSIPARLNRRPSQLMSIEEPLFEGSRAAIA